MTIFENIFRTHFIFNNIGVINYNKDPTLYISIGYLKLYVTMFVDESLTVSKE